MEQIIIRKKDLEGTIFESHYNDLAKLSLKDKNTLNGILDSVCTYFSGDKDFVISSTRQRKGLIVRDIYVLLAREVSNVSYQHTLSEIGSIINRDYSSVIHSLNRVKNDYLTCNKFKIELDAIVSSFFGNEGMNRLSLFINRKQGIKIRD